MLVVEEGAGVGAATGVAGAADAVVEEGVAAEDDWGSKKKKDEGGGSLLHFVTDFYSL